MRTSIILLTIIKNSVTKTDGVAYNIAMYELKLSKPPLYRVKRGQTPQEISEVFGCPVPQDTECGDIIAVPSCAFVLYSARVGESYASIAAKFGITEEELKRCNGGKPVYPTCKLFIPQTEGEDGIL